MSDSLTIKSDNDDHQVELKSAGRDYFEVTIQGIGLSAFAKVAHIGGGDGLHLYWADLSNHWRGWSKEKVWQSHEGDLEFSAKSDRTGHVTVRVTLARGADWKWKVQAFLIIEAGHLEGLAAAALAYAQNLGAIA